MSHTHWDPKGIVQRRPGGYTYYGGNTKLSARYKDRYIPHYNPQTTLSDVDRTDKLDVLNQSENWNKYQKRMWYQDCLDHTTPEYEEFPGIHAEWRNEGEFDKSYRKYNSKFVYDFRVNVTTTDADGVERTQQMRTADHTDITRLRRDMEEAERYDLRTPDVRRTVDFADLASPVSREGEQEEDRVQDNQHNDRILSRQNTDETNPEIQFFDQGETLKSSTRPHSASASIRRRSVHPSINSGLCGEHPRDTFKKKEQFPMFWSGTQKEDFRHHRSSSNLLDTTSGRCAHDEYANKKRTSIDHTPYGTRPMTSEQITLRSQGGRNPTTSNLSTRSRRPQSGYERGLTGTLQKNDGWRDESLLTNAGKIVFYPLSFDVLETLTFPRAGDSNREVQAQVEKKPMSPMRVDVVNRVFTALVKQSKSSDGTASIQCVMAAFRPAAHPAVVSKRVTEQDIHDSFILDLYRLVQFEMHGSVFDVFEHYLESDLIADVNAGDTSFDVTSPVFYTLYEAYSQGIQNDGYFERLVLRTWHSLALGGRAVSKKKNFLTSSYCRRMGSMGSMASM